MMHTLALIWQLTLTPVQCNLETADRWFEVAQGTINIRAAVVRHGVFHPTTQFIKIFKYGGSLGTDSWIYYPCDLTPTEPHLRDQESKGSCL
jgi:hypothetical protein